MFLILLLISFSLPSFSAVNTESALQIAKNDLLKQQTTSGAWRGNLQSDPSGDVLFAVLAKQLEKSSPFTKEELLERLTSWKGKQDAWGFAPESRPSIDVTGTILLGLEALGVAKNDPVVVGAWRWFASQGGVRNMDAIYRILLNSLNLSPYSLPISVDFLGQGNLSLVNIHSLGVYRSILVPVLTLNYYRDQMGGPVSPLDPERLASKGSEFTKSSFFRTKEFWAQEALGWLVDHQQKDGPWYTFHGSLVSLITLKTAQDLKVANFSKEIEKGFQGLVDWIRFDPSLRQRFIAPSQSEGWDTPMSLLAFLRNSEEFSMEETQSIQKGIDWIVKAQPKVKGDWSYLAPELAPGGWSFVENNPFYPDTDVTGVSLESMARVIAKPELGASVDLRSSFDQGLAWLLGMQNKDGAFPAWDRNASKAFAFISKLFGFTPIMDIGQVDLSSRILEEFSTIKDLGVLTEAQKKAVDKSIRRACVYVGQHTATQNPKIWFGDWAVNYVYATAQAVSGLLAANCADVSTLTDSVNWIVSVQNKDGGWGEDFSSYERDRFVAASSTLFQTVTPIHGLIRYELAFRKKFHKASPFRKSIDRAISYMNKEVLAGNHLMERSFAGVLVKGKIFANYDLTVVDGVLMSLTEYNHLLKVEEGF